MDRLSALDASFLRVETPSAHMHVGWTATVELPRGTAALDAGAVRARLAERLHLAPRFRQVVRTPLGGLSRPVWVDDPGFDVARHVVVHPEALEPGELGRISERFLSAPLHRDHPLWEVLVVPRLRRGRAAVLGKVHHAMVDGIAAVQLAMLLFDTDPEPARASAPAWEPHKPGPVGFQLGAVRDSALEQFRTARRAAGMGLAPGQGIRVADTVRRAAFSLAEDAALKPAPRSYLNDPIGPRRRLVGTAVPLHRLQTLKTRAEAKLNDVVLALVAGVLGRLAAAHDEPARDVRAMVPATVRADRAATEGNAISFLFVDLPVASAPAGQRIGLIRDRMRALKEQGRVGGTDGMLKLLEGLPEPAQAPAARLATSPRLYNLTVSNLPGPPVPLYVQGARVDTISPVIPVPERHALSVGALSYEGRLHMSAYFDPEALPRGGRLPLLVADALEELETVTRRPERVAA
jgi:diacylglycerol O-acyltransferase / wax synthase